MSQRISINGKPLPATVVFDLRSTMHEYETHIARMSQAEIDLEALFNDVLNAIRFKFCYPGELISMAHFFVESMAGSLREDIDVDENGNTIVRRDADYLYDAIMEIGHALYSKLCRAGFYDKDAAIHHYDVHGFDTNQALVLTYQDHSELVAY